MNGHPVAEKLDWAKERLKQQMPVSPVFEKDEMTDDTGVIKGKGYKRVTSCWHTKKLPHKTHGDCARLPLWHPCPKNALKPQIFSDRFDF